MEDDFKTIKNEQSGSNLLKFYFHRILTKDYVRGCTWQYKVTGLLQPDDLFEPSVGQTVDLRANPAMYKCRFFLRCVTI